MIDPVYPLIWTKQCGFIEGRANILKLLPSISLIVDLIDSKHSMDAICLDVRKAFDSISHQVLLP